MPGQNVETMRERLRITPLPHRVRPEPALGLPYSGPKGVIPGDYVQESRNDWKYAPPVGH